MIALANYIDEHLTTNNNVDTSSSPHKKIGGLLIISTFLSMCTVLVIGLYASSLTISTATLLLVFASSVTTVMLWAGYFYLLLLYPAHQIVPLFSLSSIWAIGIELFFGTPITLVALLGVALLSIGAYLVDAGSIRLKIPTQLFAAMSGVSLLWAITIKLVDLASITAPSVTIFFYQYLGISIIGLSLFVFIKPYRDGFIHRLRTQKSFIGLSVINELISQVAYFFVVIAIALVPFVPYISALGGMQGIFLLILFYFFPLGKRSSITPTQWFAMAIIACGVFVIEFWR